MSRIRDLAIRQKIILITMLISAVALLIAGAELFFYDRIQSRHELENSVKTIAAITADNVMAAVSFHDEKAATDTLNALQSDPSIVSACVYTDPAVLLAQYNRQGTSPSCPEDPGNEGLTYDSRSLSVTQAVHLSGAKKIGSLRITTTLAPLTARTFRDLSNIGVVTLVAAVFALALSWKLQHWVSGPLLDLTRTTKSVSDTQNYSIRARKHADDELGTLVDSVNEMLSQISQAARDKEDRLLREHDLRKEAEEANRLKDQFLATLSHELRTPLNAIVGWAALLSKREAQDKTFQVGMEAVYRNAHAQAKLIEDLLDVSRITTGKFPMEWSNIAIGEVIEAAVESIRPAAAAKHIEIDIGQAGATTRINADSGRLRQAITNILTNAVKFTKEGGRISIGIQVNVEHLEVTISDNGVGIPAEFLPYVFDRFRQADGSNTRQFGGLGIGLAISRHIVESHGGTIHAFSEGLNQGATFRISLPRTSSAGNAGMNSGGYEPAAADS